MCIVAKIKKEVTYTAHHLITAIFIVQHTFNGLNHVIFKVGETVTWRCDPGYRLKGATNNADNRTTVTCTSASVPSWPPNPECERKLSINDRQSLDCKLHIESFAYSTIT